MSKTLVRTDQLDKTFRQTFNNLSGLQPIFDFNFNGLSTGEQTLWQAVIEKSPFTNKNIPITSDTQALVNITNKDDTFNRASLWLKYDKPTTPADWGVKGILHQARNDVVSPIGNLFVVQPVSSTSGPMAVWYLETGGPTANARPFYAQDVRVFDGTTTFNSTGWIGYTSYFKSTGAIGFRALNRGTNSDPIGFLAYAQTQPEDVTGVAKFGYVCRLDRSASASSPSYLIGYRTNIIDSVGSTTYYNSGFEVGVFTPNVSTVSGSTGFKVFGTGTVQNFTGFAFYESSFSNPANNVGFAVGIKSSSSIGMSIFFGSSISSGFVKGIFCNDSPGNTYNTSQFSAFYWSGFSGIWGNTAGVAGSYSGFAGTFNGPGLVIGFFSNLQGTISSTGYMYGVLLGIENGTVNGTYKGIVQTIDPVSVGASATIVGSYIRFNNTASTAATCIGYQVTTNGDITSNFLLGMVFSQLGTATSVTQYNSFTTRWTSSNWDTGVSGAVSIDWDARAIGVSGNPPNSRLGIFRDGNELFNIQRLGDIEVITADKGIILKSPNGTRYRVKVNDAGGLVTEAV